MIFIYLTLGLILEAGLFGLWDRAQRRRHAVDRAAVAASLNGTGVLLDAAAVVNADLRATIETQAALIAELEHQNRTVDLKLSNTQQHIASVCYQRDFWQEWYHRQVSEHGAAQHLFMSELELHVKSGSKHPPSAIFSVLVNDFQDIHPALAAQGQPAKPGLKPLAER